MPHYAVINNNRVVNTLVCDTLEDAMQLTGLECKEINDEFPHHTGYELKDGVWVYTPITGVENA